MRVSIRFILPFLSIFFLTGCFELIEDTTIHQDGSGTYKLTLNMSASQTRLNSIMALDSIKGKKVPSESEIKNELAAFIQQMNSTPGIVNSNYMLDTDNWIFKLTCSFDSLPCLKNAFQQASEKWLKKETDKKELEEISITYDGQQYVRSFSAELNDDTRKEVRKDEDYGQLANGKCVFIQRFDKSIESVSQQTVRIAKKSKSKHVDGITY